MSLSFIDIHCHILPGLDDGPETIAGSIEMARVAYRNGIDRIIATPHHNDYHQPPVDEILRRTKDLNEMLKQERIPVTVFPGNELRIALDLPEKLHNREVLSLAGSRYILLEFPFDNIPLFASGIISQLLSDGWRPILAHCERIYDIQHKPGLVEKYVAMGCMIQINANSLTGELGKMSYRTGIELLKLGHVNIIASDAHASRRRIPDPSKALKITSRIVGRAAAEAMVSETPAAILVDSGDAGPGGYRPNK